MKLLTAAIEKKLIANHLANASGENTTDFKPVVKFFGGAACTWLISEYDKENDTFFGLCDLGHGSPELGYVSKTELESVRFQFGLGVERDRHTTFDKKMSEYAKLASEKGRIEA